MPTDVIIPASQVTPLVPSVSRTLEEQKSALIAEAQDFLSRYPKCKPFIDLPLINLRWSAQNPARIQATMADLSQALEETKQKICLPLQKSRPSPRKKHLEIILLKKEAMQLIRAAKELEKLQLLSTETQMELVNLRLNLNVTLACDHTGAIKEKIKDLLQFYNRFPHPVQAQSFISPDLCPRHSCSERRKYSP